MYPYENIKGLLVHLKNEYRNRTAGLWGMDTAILLQFDSEMSLARNILDTRSLACGSSSKAVVPTGIVI